MANVVLNSGLIVLDGNSHCYLSGEKLFFSVSWKASFKAGPNALSLEILAIQAKNNQRNVPLLKQHYFIRL